MTSFHNVRLPVDVEQGAQGGPAFKTTILPLSSGFEQRNIDWERQRGDWDVSYGVRTKSDLDEVVEFFHVRRGRAYGFRFKDWSDFEITAQAIGTGDGSNAAFQVFKRYTSGSDVFDRRITRLVTGTLSVFVNAVLKTVTTHYTVNLETGLITFTGGNIPTLGQIVSVTVEFDIPVRFDIDKLNVKMHWEEAMEIPSIPILELKE